MSAAKNTTRMNEYDNQIAAEQRYQCAERMTLAAALELAQEDSLNWCIVPIGYDMTIAKLVFEDEVKVVKVLDEEGSLLRFPTMPQARDFLQQTFGVQRTSLLPL
jgi:hypothetical protein